MEIVIVIVFFIASIGFFYCLIKFCKKYRTHEQGLLDDYNELDNVLDLEENPTELTQVNYITQSTDECSICLETFENKEIAQFECFHKYHIECINDWINRRNNNINCPECGI
jgi:hypothetical protein